MAIHASQIEAFRHDGVVCLRGALGERGVEIARDAFEYRMQNARRSARSRVADDGSLNYSDLFKIIDVVPRDIPACLRRDAARGLRRRAHGVR